MAAKERRLIDALSPVNHKGLQQGWKQTSIYPQAIHSTSHHTASLFFFPSQTTAQIRSTVSERKTWQTITHVLEPIYIPRALNTGTCIQQGAYFILRVYTGTDLSYSYHRKNSGEILEKMQVNGPEG